MNKTELISAVAQTAEMTKKDSEKAVKAVIDVIRALKGEIRFSLSVSVHSKSASAKPVKATTRRPRKLLRFRLPRARLGEFPNS